MRTHCITIDLANQGRRQVRARFDGGRMSSDGGALLLELFLDSHAAAPEEIVLDAPDDPLHGRQEGRFFHGYYDCYCYLPLYVTCGPHLLCGRQRASTTCSAWPRTRGGQREVCSPCANSPSRTGRVPRNRSRLTQIWLREGIPEHQGREISCRPASNSPLPGPVTPKSEAA